MILKRKIYNRLLDWKENSRGQTALLLEGARRTGKSFIVSYFGQNEYKSYLVIDFSTIDDTVKDIFLSYRNDLDTFFLLISNYFSVRFYKRDTLIIFDEVQTFPLARQFIKQLVADGRYDYIETGSLLSIKQNIDNIVLPSEEVKLEMFPLDFEEFLWALNDSLSIPMIKHFFDIQKPIGEANHKKLMLLFRQYILVGGMPQAVIKYVETKDFGEVDIIKRNILNLYRNDVSKFAKGYEHKVLSIFDEIPSQLSKHEKKFQLSVLQNHARYRDYESAFIWLSEAMITNNCFNSTDPTVGLGLNADRATLKCYMTDTGLLITHAFSENEQTNHEVYKQILFDKLNINEGMIMENVVAQILRSNGHQLYFYSKASSEKEDRMEIDFLISKGNKVKMKVSPIEVKSSKNYSFTSLNKFQNKYSQKIGQRYILHTKDLTKKNDILLLPIYMAIFL